RHHPASGDLGREWSPTNDHSRYKSPLADEVTASPATVGAACYTGAMTETLDRTELRTRAETLLRALAGAGATLREDQWTAIEALVADRRRALVVQRTGWGKSAVYFIA